MTIKIANLDKNSHEYPHEYKQLQRRQVTTAKALKACSKKLKQMGDDTYQLVAELKETSKQSFTLFQTTLKTNGEVLEVVREQVGRIMTFMEQSSQDRQDAGKQIAGTDKTKREKELELSTQDLTLSSNSRPGQGSGMTSVSFAEREAQRVRASRGSIDVCIAVADAETRASNDGAAPSRGANSGAAVKRRPSPSPPGSLASRSKRVPDSPTSLNSFVTARTSQTSVRPVSWGSPAEMQAAIEAQLSLGARQRRTLATKLSQRLHNAVRECDADTVRLLCKEIAKMQGCKKKDQSDYIAEFHIDDIVDGRTALIAAATSTVDRSKAYKMVESLLNVHANIYSGDETSGRTALHWAVYYQDEKMVKLWVQRMEYFGTTDRDGWTAAQLAETDQMRLTVKEAIKARQ